MRILTRLLAGTVTVAATTVGVAVAGTTAAQAHLVCTGLGAAGGACVHAGHHRVTVTDGACDGHEVHATVVFANGTSEFVFDPSGCGRGIGDKTFERTIVRFRFCVEGIGCTSWRPA
jgi:hypothetical protein